MAQPQNLLDRYDINPSVREDLIDKIYNVSPEEVPVTTAFGKGTAKNSYHEWQRDSLSTPNKDNSLIDGDDWTGQPIAPTQRIGNYCQILSKQPGVSRRANIVDKAGMKSAMAWAKAKMIKEIKRDMEAMVLSDNAAVAGNSTTPSKSAGLGTMIYTNVSSGAGGSTPAHIAGAPLVPPVKGTNRPFTEDLLKQVVGMTYTSSAEIPSMVVVSPYHKEVFSTFAGIAANREAVKSGKQARIVAGADLYMSNFGELEIIPHYILANSTNAFLLNPDYAEMAFLDGFRFEEMGKTGDSEKLLLTVDVTLRVDNEKAMGKIADLTPTGPITLMADGQNGTGTGGNTAPYQPGVNAEGGRDGVSEYFRLDAAPMGDPPDPKDPKARRENTQFGRDDPNYQLRKDADAREAALRQLEESSPARGSNVGVLAEPLRGEGGTNNTTPPPVASPPANGTKDGTSTRKS